MTEKRFTITQDFEEHHRQIRDNGHIIMGCFVEPQAEVIVDFLNQLNDENEQLKQYIYDNLDEDICDVCSYQYLEKSQMDKYYVAKCKKGYDNCSKGTVIHCKDFKFKELQRNG